MPDPDWWLALWPRPGQTLTDLGIAPDMDIAVDLCCGDGLFTAPLAGLARHVVAINIDPRMLDLAWAQVATVGAASACEFIEGDAHNIARMVRRPADLVLIANTFHGVPDKVGLARAVATVTKPGNRFIVVSWHKRPREETTVLGQPRGPRTEMRMTSEDVTAAVVPAGLRLVRTAELPPYHYGTISEKPTGVSPRRAPTRTFAVWLGAPVAFAALPAMAQDVPAGWGHGPGMMWGGGWAWMMLFGPLTMIPFVAAVVVLVAVALRWLGGSGLLGAGHAHSLPPGRTPLDILKERFARGEIDKAEFEERRRILGE